MTSQNSAAQAANPDFVATELRGIIDVCGGSPTAIVSVERMRLWLSKLRAPVADERAALRQAVTLLLQVHPLLGPCDHELRDRIGAFLGKGGAS